jgi:hypothetical protein
MPALTRRRHPERPDCWHVYFGDVQVGSIGKRSGIPNGVDEWGWTCGFISQRLRITEGTAPTFDLARAKFEKAWQAYLPGCIDADFAEHREHRAWTTWKYAMHDAGLRLPTQVTCGRTRCFCGAKIDIASMPSHAQRAPRFSSRENTGSLGRYWRRWPSCSSWRNSSGSSAAQIPCARTAHSAQDCSHA